MSLRAWFLHLPALWLHIGVRWRNRRHLAAGTGPAPAMSPNTPGIASPPRGGRAADESGEGRAVELGRPRSHVDHYAMAATRSQKPGVESSIYPWDVH